MTDVFAPVKVAVIGVGHLGKHHVRLLSQNPAAELVGIADARLEAMAPVEHAYGVRGYQDYRQLLGSVEAVCIAVPTTLHHEIARFFLSNGVDVFVEKPIASTVEQGEDLVQLARAGARILQVGHVERFNPALKSIQDLGLEPRYIESHRLAGMTFRSMDIGVVLDLMIHDLDLVLALVRSPVKSVDAFGGALFTKGEDIASAIVKFEDGAVAHLTANRVALKPMRRMRMFCRDAYVSLDFHEAEGLVIRKNEGWDIGALDMQSIDISRIEDLTKFVFEGLLSVHRYQLDEGNPLGDELSAFLSCVRTGARPLVGGEEGVAAVKLGQEILRVMRAHRW
jgi:predicted dehydrogenase